MRILAPLLALVLAVGDEPTPSPTPVAPAASGPLEECRLGLRDAIRIGLDNSEVVRVIRLGALGPTTPDNVAGRFADPVPSVADVVIARPNADASIWDFRANAMAHVRSIERQYWSLWQMQVAVEARESAVVQGEELLARERAELESCRCLAIDSADVEEPLEVFRRHLVAAKADRVAAERQLREILGLPEADGRRIVAATPPVEAKVEPDWESCVREMGDLQPDMAQQRIIIRLAELQLLVARNQLLPPMIWAELSQLNSLGDRLDVFGPYLPGVIRSGVIQQRASQPNPAGLDPARPAEADFTNRQFGLAVPIPMSVGRSPLANTRQAQYQLLRQRASLQRITHESTHSLARFFLEVDANHKQYKAARRLEGAARRRVEAQRAFYEEGRITPDRLLDAIGQRADAVALEARHLAGYNTSLATLEEAKGTLLASDGIEVADGPSPRKAFIPPKDREVAPAALEKPDELPELPAPAPVPSRPAAKTFRLRAKLGGVRFLEVEVEVNPASP